MSEVLLVYPYTLPRGNRSIFRFPPLGVAYVAASLRKAGHGVSILDCTFAGEGDLLSEVSRTGADVAGVYSMVTLQDESLRIARLLRGHVGLLLAGGPLPSGEPDRFLADFDVAVRGEGEEAVVEIVDAYSRGSDLENLASIAGISYMDGSFPQGTHNPDRPLAALLDDLPFPARDLLPNDAYRRYGRRKYGRSITSIMTSRGCPYSCEFCSNAVFGRTFRERSAENVVDEVEQVLELGYERVHFADDVFTLDRARLRRICAEIERRGLKFGWECLARADSVDRESAEAMRSAGCYRVFFGIESGVDEVLQLMGKQTTREQVTRAVGMARGAGLQVGGFFILCYPGETDATVLETIRFAGRLPLQYVSFTVPYLLSGTSLHQRMGASVTKEWVQPKARVMDHVCHYKGEFSERKMKFSVIKGRVQSYLHHHLGWPGKVGGLVFEKVTDLAFRALR